MVDRLRRSRFGWLRLPMSGQSAARLRPLVEGAALLALFAGALALVQFAAPGLAGNDGYYHMKMGLLMRQQGLKPTFIWLPLSILSPKGYYDHHLLYHVYLALFVAVWWLLRGRGVRWAGLWSLGLLAVSDAFLYRMSMPRAQSASLLALALGVHWLLKRRYRLLGVLGFLYVWLYNAFPLLLLLAAAYVAVTFVTERRLEWQPLAVVGLGIGLGVVVNPYFPQNVAFIINHLLPKVGAINERVGTEWYPYETWTLVENATGAWLALLGGVLAMGWNEKRVDRPTLFALALALLFGLLVFKSRRFVEYFPAFALIFGAMSVSRLVDGVGEGVWRRWALAGLAMAMVALSARSLLRAREAMERTLPADLYADAATWLAENSQPGEMVFQTDWDDFTRLFFYDTSNVYTIGLDVTYMQRYSPALYDEWVAITRGEVAAPSHVIASDFSADYVFSDLGHSEFLEAAVDDPLLVEVYRDDDAVIFRVDE